MENQQSTGNTQKYLNKNKAEADENGKINKKNISLYYDMNNKHRGYALIFNHEEFKPNSDENESVHLATRKGTQVDCDRFRLCLEDLGFKVKVFRDLSKLDVFKALKKFSQKDHSKNDCFLVAVLTHGDEGKLYAYDGEYECEKLWSPFYKTRCPSLAGKPKIFLVQACQGNMLDDGVILDRHFDENNSNNNNNMNTYCMDVDFSRYVAEKPLSEDSYFPYQPVNECDFLTVFSTPPGYFSWRNRVYGSWFIQAFCKEFENNAYKAPLLHIVTNVIQEVAIEYISNVPDDGRRNGKKQVPFASNTFLKICQFHEKKKGKKFLGLKL